MGIIVNKLVTGVCGAEASSLVCSEGEAAGTVWFWQPGWGWAWREAEEAGSAWLLCTERVKEMNFGCFHGCKIASMLLLSSVIMLHKAAGHAKVW